MNTELNQSPAPIMPEQAPEVQPLPETETREPISFWVFFGLIALFAIPVVGFISAIVFLFVPKNKSLKNFSGAVLAWMVIRIVALVLTATLVLGALGTLILPAINEQFGSELGSISEMFGLATEIKKGNYSGAIRLFRGPILEAIGDDYAPLLDEFATGKYDDVINQIKNEEYAAVLADLENGKYDELVNKMEPGDYRELKEELQKAAEGKPSEVFDNLKTFLNEPPENLLNLLQ